VEAGESRTPLSISETISNNIPHVSSLSTSSVLETSFRQASYSTNFECNPSKLLPQLLDQLIALGQTAQQLRQALDNGHHPDKVADLVKQSLEGGGHAP